MSIALYIGQIRTSVQQSDGERLRSLFKLDSDAYQIVNQLVNKGLPVPSGEIQRQLPPPWGDIVASFLQSLSFSIKGERLNACKEFREGHARGMLEALKETKDSPWIVPAVLGMAVTLKQLAQMADVESSAKGTSGNQVSALAMFLQQLFSSTAASKGAASEPKRQAAVAIGCIMMKVYFLCNTINNCKNVIQTVDVTLNMLGSAPAAHRVTFRYYTGRLAAYDEDFQKADEHLTYALDNCHRDATSNKAKILRYLVPVRMLRGILPSDQLLEMYHLQEYKDVKEAVMNGDVALLLRSLEENQVGFVQAGTYLLLEKLLLSTYRRLFRKMAVIHSELNPAKATQLPLGLLHKALELQGIEKDNAELQCILANLIYRKYIKGYIAFKPKILVLAKTDAFPDLSGVQLGDPFTL